MDYCLKAAMITGAARCTSWVFHKTRIKRRSHASDHNYQQRQNRTSNFQHYVGCCFGLQTHRGTQSQFFERRFSVFSYQKTPSNAKRIVQRQFNALLERCKLKHDRHAKTVHTVYSLRHTAICMRIILSEGQVNIFNLAKNAGNFGGSDRTLLCSQSPSLSGDGEEFAEFWEWVSRQMLLALIFPFRH